MEKIIKVNGMHCKSCEILITDVISEIKGVSTVKVDSKKGLVVLNLTDSSIIENVKSAIEKEGYKVII